MQSELIRTDQLASADRAAMYALFDSHFEGVTPEVFATDLNLKNWVLLIKDDKDTLKGFSTLLMYDLVFEDELLTIVYSGDTVMDPGVWSSSALSRDWVNAVNQLRSHYQGETLYWLLISSGFRTYRFLPTFWQTFYPRYDQPTPPKMQRLMQFLCCRQFGNWYDEAAGVVRFPVPQKLGINLSGIPSERLRNPHVKFFAQQNPGHAQGDELVCLTRFAVDNLTPAGQRMWFSHPSPMSGRRSM